MVLLHMTNHKYLNLFFSDKAMLRELLRQATRWHRIERAFGKRRATSPRAVRLSFKDKCKSIRQKLVYLYGEQRGNETYEKIERKIAAFVKKKPHALKLRDAHFTPKNRFTEKDAVLITYPDTIRYPGERPLVTLKRLATLDCFLNTLHILPFFPSSSDRGFAVINYKKVDSKFGTWDDIETLSTKFNLMVDGVFNHCSRQNHWFRRWLADSEVYKNHFISFDTPDAITPEQLAKIVRPRTTPLLTPFRAVRNGKRVTRYVWTTFSKDQVDLNWKEPRILLRVVDIIFRYLRHGATLIRLDAVNYLWKELGTSCSHLKQTHIIVQLLRDILDLAAPSVNLITETNVVHSKNSSYFGNGKNEAQMIYNFTLPPLLLHAFYEGKTHYLSRWADRLERTSSRKTSPYTTYFNFLASHDGIGLMPVKRLLPQREVKKLVRKARQHGSLVSYKQEGGKREPYELNITWWSALYSPQKQELNVPRYLASWSIALALKGVPGIYIHALFATPNDVAGVKQSGVARDINRANLCWKSLQQELRRSPTKRAVLAGLRTLLKTRRAHKAFHPASDQRVLFGNEHVFALLRSCDSERILCLTNVTAEEQWFRVNLEELTLAAPLTDLLTQRRLFAHTPHRVHEVSIRLAPYETVWLKG